MGLHEIPALTYAGLRYGIAFLCLLPFAMRPSQIQALKALPRKDWYLLILLGVLYYAVTQGAQFIALSYMPASIVTLLLNFTTVLVALFGIMFLRERPSVLQWVGVTINIVGILIFFSPFNLPSAQVLGILIVFVGIFANAFSSILGRRANRNGDLAPVTITCVSMGIGSVLLLGTGLPMQGLPDLSWSMWAMIGWLAVVNTAFAFTLWNRTLRVLTAMQSSITTNTMPIQITLMVWLFFGESMTLTNGIGMVLACVGTFLVQWRPKKKALPKPLEPETLKQQST